MTTIYKTKTKYLQNKYLQHYFCKKFCSFDAYHTVCFVSGLGTCYFTNKQGLTHA